MQYHCVYLGNTAVVRPAIDGIREFEWFHGCRSIPPNGMREYELKHHIRSLKYHLLSTEDWNNFISSLDEPLFLVTSLSQPARYGTNGIHKPPSIE